MQKPKVPAYHGANLKIGGYTATNWYFDPQAITKAIADLGITSPVEMKITGGGSGTYGTHFWRKNPDRHLIVIARHQDSYYASRAIWHELTHAAQSDKLGPERWRKVYEHETKVRGYRDNRLEVQARRMEPRAINRPLTSPS